MILSQSHDRWRPRSTVLALMLLTFSTLLVPIAWGAPTSGTRTDNPPPVRVGLDRVADEFLDVLEGKRVALVAHAASVTADGRHAIDVLRAAEIEVVRVLAPEHGLRGHAAAGERVADGRDPATGLPVVSLYGAVRKPTPAHLSNVDALVFDLQGGGVRFYTYASTLILCLEAAAERGLEIIVLDRPNPLGGLRVEGPIAAPRDQVAASFVNRAPGPLVHGLTLGEMARFVNRSLPRRARLTVVPMQGWTRSMTWTDTGRPWVPPSPNLRDPNAALAYPGVALLEATNVSEGRGTEAPFLRLGAPWLSKKTRWALNRLVVPGFQFESTLFIPRADHTAPHPKHAGETCRGLRVRVVDTKRATPYGLGIDLLTILTRDPAFRWRDGGRALTTLLGTPTPLAMLQAGADADTIIAADAAAHTQWREERRDALLYP